MEANRFRFRAWDKVERLMVSVNEINWAANFVAGVYDKGGTSGVVEDFILMQSTGINDNEGNEVFEGDLIEIDPPHPDYKPEIKQIRFGSHNTSGDYYASYAYGWYASRPGGEGEVSLEQIGGHWKVIGNIYENENPELLEAK